MFPFHMALTRKHMRIKTWIKPIWYLIANSFDINVPYTFDSLPLSRITCFYFLSSSAFGRFYMTHCIVLKKVIYRLVSPLFAIVGIQKMSKSYESQLTKSDNAQKNTTWFIFWKMAMCYKATAIECFNSDNIYRWKLKV